MDTWKPNPQRPIRSSKAQGPKAEGTRRATAREMAGDTAGKEGASMAARAAITEGEEKKARVCHRWTLWDFGTHIKI